MYGDAETIPKGRYNRFPSFAVANLELTALSQVLLQQVPGTLQRLQQHVREQENRVVELEAQVTGRREFMTGASLQKPPWMPTTTLTTGSGKRS